jgi:tyrosyl-tRNA synthetase
LSVFEGVPTYKIDRKKLDAGVPVVELLVTETAVFPSKGELRRTIKGNGLSLNKAKLTDQEYLVTEADLINGSYLLVQKGKKNYYIIEVV